MKTDSQLQRDVMDELARDTSIHANEIGVEVQDGIVTLSGNVASFLEKCEAERVAARVAGARAIVVSLEVLPTSKDRHTDADIAKAALAVLKWHAGLPVDGMHVKVENGWVTIEGNVESYTQRVLAENAVRTLRSVRGVINDIKVQDSPRRSEVVGHIAAALARQALREAHHIEISLLGNGEVLLTGKVHSLAEKEAIRGAAMTTHGVCAVVDRMTVE
ncbi:transport-associated protein [Pandoraea horticolens]|uniref:Transport-associated protein n=1 Tax=Pandoraea horticolens TaxID=2508298 RepID=A0A5E4WFV2_9BURK|nr:BON domain-containing protein [Pandoraea horticolens]VVE22320.1 transport-associated protein [Pandoraea horticolens]